VIIPIGDDNPVGRPPIVTHLIIALNVVIALWLGFAGEPTRIRIINQYGLIPARYSLTTALTSMFLHTGIAHMILNMLFLAIFADNIEDILGAVRFIALYVAGGLISAIVYTLLNRNSLTPCVGASGAVSATLGVYLVFFPRHEVHFISLLGARFGGFSEFWIKAKYCIPLYFAAQFVLLALGLGGDSVAYGAQFGGFAFGVVSAAFARSLYAERLATMPPRRVPRATRPLKKVVKSKRPTHAELEEVAVTEPLKDDRVHTVEELLNGELPRTSEFEKYVVVRASEDEISLPDLAETISKAAQVPLADVSRLIRQSHGFLLRGISLQQARKVVIALKQKGMHALTVEEKRVVPLPPVRRVRAISFDDESIAFKVGDEWEKAAWSDFFLACCGWIVERAESEPSAGAFAGVTPEQFGKPVFRKFDFPMSGHEERRMYVEFLFQHPWRRYRVEPGRVQVAREGRNIAGVRNGIEQIVRLIEEKYSEEAVTSALRNYAHRDKLRTGRLTYRREEDFDDYVSWLVLLRSLKKEVE